MDLEADRTLARLEADRSEIDVEIKRYNMQQRLHDIPLSSIDQLLYAWLRQRYIDLSVQIEEMSQ